MLSPEEEKAIQAARDLIDAGIPVFAARPAVLPSGERDWSGGTGKTGYILPTSWQSTVATHNWLDPEMRGFEDKAWRPGWALAAVMGHGLDLLDVDPRNGGDASRTALFDAGLWPVSYGTAATPSGGLHEFIASLDVASRDDLMPGLDVKAGRANGEGRGFAFLAPTIKRSKVSGELMPYHWVITPKAVPLAGVDASGRGIAELIATRRASTAEGGASLAGDLGQPIPHGRHDASMRDYVWRLRHRLSEGEAMVLALARGRDCVPPTWTDEMTRVMVRRAYERAVEPFVPSVELAWPAFDAAVTALADQGALPLALAEVASSDVRDRFPRLDWHELWTAPDDEEWIVEPLLPARRQVTIYSRPKIGKSLLALEIAVGIARGTLVLGVIPDRPRRVLYVDHENDPRGDIRQRLQAMGVEPGELERLDYLSFPPMAVLDGSAGGIELLAAVEAYASEVVIIDTVSRAVGGKENENDTWLGFYRNTGLALKRAGVALLRLDHSGKDEDKGQRGGSAKSGDVDAVWRMSEVVAGTTYRLDCEAHRMQVRETTLTIHRETEPVLRHKVDAEGARAAWKAKVESVIDALDLVNAEGDIGRPGAREVLRAAGITARNDVIGAAIKARKTRFELSPRSRDSPSGRHCPQDRGTPWDSPAEHPPQTAPDLGKHLSPA